MSHVDTVRGIYQAFSQGNVPAILAVLDPQIDWNESERFPYGSKFIGTQEVLSRIFLPLAKDWEGYKAEPEEFVGSGDTVVVLGSYSGTYRATGKSFHARFAHAWWLKNGRVVRYQQFTDTVLHSEAMR